MLRGSPGQVSSGGEQHGSMLSARKGAGRSQPANFLGSRATPGCLSFPSPLYLQVLSLSGQDPFPGGHEQPTGARVQYGMSVFSGGAGLGWLLALLHAWQRRGEPCPQQAGLVNRPWEYYFPAAAQSLETWPHWPQSYSCGLSLATLESRIRDFSLTVQSRGLACVLGAASSRVSLCRGDPGLQHLSLLPPGREGLCSGPSSPQPASAEPWSPPAGCVFPPVLVGLPGCVCILSRVS